MGQPAPDGHALLLGIGRPTQAKANVKNLGIDWNQAVGRALGRAIAIVGWSQKEAAAKLGIGEAELSKWLSGERRQHLDRILAVERLQQPFIACLAGLFSDVEVVTEIRLKAVTA